MKTKKFIILINLIYILLINNLYSQSNYADNLKQLKINIAIKNYQSKDFFQNEKLYISDVDYNIYIGDFIDYKIKIIPPNSNTVQTGLQNIPESSTCYPDGDHTNPQPCIKYTQYNTYTVYSYSVNTSNFNGNKQITVENDQLNYNFILIEKIEIYDKNFNSLIKTSYNNINYNNNLVFNTLKKFEFNNLNNIVYIGDSIDLNYYLNPNIMIVETNNNYGYCVGSVTQSKTFFFSEGYGGGICLNGSIYYDGNSIYNIPTSCIGGTYCSSYGGTYYRKLTYKNYNTSYTSLTGAITDNSLYEPQIKTDNVINVYNNNVLNNTQTFNALKPIFNKILKSQLYQPTDIKNYFYCSNNKIIISDIYEKNGKKFNYKILDENNNVISNLISTDVNNNKILTIPFTLTNDPNKKTARLTIKVYYKNENDIFDTFEVFYWLVPNTNVHDTNASTIRSNIGGGIENGLSSYSRINLTNKKMVVGGSSNYKYWIRRINVMPQDYNNSYNWFNSSDSIEVDYILKDIRYQNGSYPQTGKITIGATFIEAYNSGCYEINRTNLQWGSILEQPFFKTKETFNILPNQNISNTSQFLTYTNVSSQEYNLNTNTLDNVTISLPYNCEYFTLDKNSLLETDDIYTVGYNDNLKYGIGKSTITYSSKTKVNVIKPKFKSDTTIYFYNDFNTTGYVNIFDSITNLTNDIKAITLNDFSFNSKRNNIINSYTYKPVNTDNINDTLTATLFGQSYKTIVKIKTPYWLFDTITKIKGQPNLNYSDLIGNYHPEIIKYNNSVNPDPITSITLDINRTITGTFRNYNLETLKKNKSLNINVLVPYWSVKDTNILYSENISFNFNNLLQNKDNSVFFYRYSDYINELKKSQTGPYYYYSFSYHNSVAINNAKNNNGIYLLNKVTKDTIIANLYNYEYKLPINVVVPTFKSDSIVKYATINETIQLKDSIINWVPSLQLILNGNVLSSNIRTITFGKNQPNETYYIRYQNLITDSILIKTITPKFNFDTIKYFYNDFSNTGYINIFDNIINTNHPIKILNNNDFTYKSKRNNLFNISTYKPINTNNLNDTLTASLNGIDYSTIIKILTPYWLYDTISKIKGQPDLLYTNLIGNYHPEIIKYNNSVIPDPNSYIKLDVNRTISGTFRNYNFLTINKKNNLYVEIKIPQWIVKDSTIFYNTGNINLLPLISNSDNTIIFSSFKGNPISNGIFYPNILGSDTIFASIYGFTYKLPINVVIPTFKVDSITKYATTQFILLKDYINNWNSNLNIIQGDAIGSITQGNRLITFNKFQPIETYYLKFNNLITDTIIIKTITPEWLLNDTILFKDDPYITLNNYIKNYDIINTVFSNKDNNGQIGIISGNYTYNPNKVSNDTISAKLNGLTYNLSIRTILPTWNTDNIIRIKGSKKLNIINFINNYSKINYKNKLVIYKNSRILNIDDTLISNTENSNYSAIYRSDAIINPNNNIDFSVSIVTPQWITKDTSIFFNTDKIDLNNLIINIDNSISFNSFKGNRITNGIFYPNFIGTDTINANLYGYNYNLIINVIIPTFKQKNIVKYATTQTIHLKDYITNWHTNLNIFKLDNINSKSGSDRLITFNKYQNIETYFIEYNNISTDTITIKTITPEWIKHDTTIYIYDKQLDLKKLINNYDTVNSIFSNILNNNQLTSNFNYFPNSLGNDKIICSLNGLNYEMNINIVIPNWKRKFDVLFENADSLKLDTLFYNFHSEIDFRLINNKAYKENFIKLNNVNENIISLSAYFRNINLGDYVINIKQPKFLNDTINAFIGQNYNFILSNYIENFNPDGVFETDQNFLIKTKESKDNYITTVHYRKEGLFNLIYKQNNLKYTLPISVKNISFNNIPTQYYNNEKIDLTNYLNGYNAYYSTGKIISNVNYIIEAGRYFLNNKVADNISVTFILNSDKNLQVSTTISVKEISWNGLDFDNWKGESTRVDLFDYLNIPHDPINTKSKITFKSVNNNLVSEHYYVFNYGGVDTVTALLNNIPYKKVIYVLVPKFKNVNLNSIVSNKEIEISDFIENYNPNGIIYVDNVPQQTFNYNKIGLYNIVYTYLSTTIIKQIRVEKMKILNLPEELCKNKRYLLYEYLSESINKQNIENFFFKVNGDVRGDVFYDFSSEIEKVEIITYLKIKNKEYDYIFDTSYYKINNDKWTSELITDTVVENQLDPTIFLINSNDLFTHIILNNQDENTQIKYTEMQRELAKYRIDEYNFVETYFNHNGRFKIKLEPTNTVGCDLEPHNYEIRSNIFKYEKLYTSEDFSINFINYYKGKFLFSISNLINDLKINYKIIDIQSGIVNTNNNLDITKGSDGFEITYNEINGFGLIKLLKIYNNENKELYSIKFYLNNIGTN